MQASHKTAIVIALLAVVWMASGVFGDPETVEGSSAVVEDATEVVIPSVRVTPVYGTLHTPVIATMGRMKADKAVNVRTQIRGRVSKILVTKGDSVIAGDVLVRLDPEDRAGLLVEVKARFAQREIAYQAAKKLSKGGYSSKLKVAQAKADLESSRSQVKRIQRELTNVTVRAPFDGVIDTVAVEVGDYFDKPGQVIARVMDLTVMVAVAQVAERDVGLIVVGKAANVHLADGRELSGIVEYVAKASDYQTRTFVVDVSIKVPDGSVPEGMTAEVKLPMDSVFSHKVSSALLTLAEDGQVGVKIVNDQNIVEFHRVRIVSDTQNGIWLTGLPAQTKVISVGQEFVKAGQKVNPSEGKLATMNPASKQGS